MLEIHALERYVIAPVVVFENGTDPGTDAREFCAWLRKFVVDRGRPPKELKFTFRPAKKSAFNSVIADGNADAACTFMKHVVSDDEVATLLGQLKLTLDFVDMSDVVARRTADRILNQAF